MTKLTNTMRDHVMEKAIAKSAIPGRRDKLKADLKDFGLKVYAEHVKVPPALQALWDNPETRPEMAQYLTTTISVGVDIKSRDFFYRNYDQHKDSSYYDRAKLPSTLAFDDPKLSPQHSSEYKLDGSPLEPLAKSLVKYHRETNKLEDELRNKVWALLHSATTVAKLLATWPEAEPLLPAATPKISSALIPAQTILDVNKALGFTK